MSELQTIETAVKTDTTVALTWLQKHERIIIVFLVLLAASWFGNHWLNNNADKAKLQATVAAQQLADQKNQNAQLAEQVASATTQYQATVAALTQQNAQLAAAVASRTVVLQQQQQTDQTMPLPDLGTRWEALAGLKPGDLAATPTGITVTDSGARNTVSQLEQVPVLAQNLKDTQSEVQNDQVELDKANGLIGDLNKQVTGLNTQIVDTQTADAAELKFVKASAAKAKKNWFIRGLITGAAVVGALVLHF